MITEARLNKEENFKIELINQLPTNKIIVVYSKADEQYYIVKENNYGDNLVLISLSYIDNILLIEIDEKELLNDSSFTIYLLDNLQDFADLPKIKHIIDI